MRRPENPDEHDYTEFYLGQDKSHIRVHPDLGEGGAWGGVRR